MFKHGSVLPKNLRHWAWRKRWRPMSMNTFDQKIILSLLHENTVPHQHWLCWLLHMNSLGILQENKTLRNVTASRQNAVTYIHSVFQNTYQTKRHASACSAESSVWSVCFWLFSFLTPPSSCFRMRSPFFRSSTNCSSASWYRALLKTDLKRSKGSPLSLVRPSATILSVGTQRGWRRLWAVDWRITAKSMATRLSSRVPPLPNVGYDAATLSQHLAEKTNHPRPQAKLACTTQLYLMHWTSTVLRLLKSRTLLWAACMISSLQNSPGCQLHRETSCQSGPLTNHLVSCHWGHLQRLHRTKSKQSDLGDRCKEPWFPNHYLVGLVLLLGLFGGGVQR